MDKGEIIRMAEEAGLAFGSDEYPDIWQTYMHVGREEIKRFAALVAAHEREKQAEQEPVAGENWSVFNTGACVADGLTMDEAKEYLDKRRFKRGWTAVYCLVVHSDDEWPNAAPVSIVAAVLAEREACAKVCDVVSDCIFPEAPSKKIVESCAAAIRARGEK